MLTSRNIAGGNIGNIYGKVAVLMRLKLGDKTMSRTVTAPSFEVYTFEEADKELRDRIRDDFHYNGDFGYFMLEERTATLKVIAKLLDGRLDYSISLSPDRGEYIRIKPIYDEGLNFAAFWSEINVDKECPLTGCYYDHDIIDLLSGYNLTEKAIQAALNSYLDSIHEEYEAMLTDDYLLELCESNGYEFTIDGKIY